MRALSHVDHYCKMTFSLFCFKVFDANKDAISVVINKLDRPVVATKVQLIYGRNTETDLDVLACLRMELFGCKLNGK